MSGAAVTKPAFASEQIERTLDGRVRYELRRPRPSGETHLVFEAQAFLRRLAWLIPPPRLHMLTYHGVLAPAGRWRSRVVPERIISDLTLQHRPTGRRECGERTGCPKPPAAPLMETSPPDTEPTPAQTSRSQEARGSWAILMRRVYELDVLDCDQCGGRMRVIGAIQDPSEVTKVLEHAGLPAVPPKLKSARAPPALKFSSAA